MDSFGFQTFSLDGKSIPPFKELRKQETHAHPTKSDPVSGQPHRRVRWVGMDSPETIEGDRHPPPVCAGIRTGPSSKGGGPGCQSLVEPARRDGHRLPWNGGRRQGLRTLEGRCRRCRFPQDRRFHRSSLPLHRRALPASGGGRGLRPAEKEETNTTCSMELKPG